MCLFIGYFFIGWLVYVISVFMEYYVITILLLSECV